MPSTIKIHRVLNAPPERVYRAFTDPDAMAKWLPPHGFTGHVHSLDLKVGGKYRYEWRNGANGTTMGMGGKFLEISAPERLVATELFDDPGYPGEAIDTQVLTEKGGKTTLTMTVRYASKEARDGVMEGPATSGLEHNYGNLERLLDTLS